MKPHIFIVLGIGCLAAAACVESPPSTLPHRYDCGGTPIVASAQRLNIEGVETRPVHKDRDGEHYLVSGDVELLEYVVPDDRAQDVSILSYDATTSRDRASWRLRRKGFCVASGGYMDAVDRFMKGSSVDEVAAAMSIAPDDARRLIAQGLYHLRHRLGDY